METKTKNEKPVKEFVKTKLKSANASPATIEEHIFIGHSRNSRKMHYFQGSRD